MYRSLDYGEDSQFKPAYRMKSRRFKKRNRFNYKKNLFSSNFRPSIMLANGFQTNVVKGSNNENMFWHVKDSCFSPGNNYYFNSPEEAEQIFKVIYSNDLKNDWYEKTTQFRTHNDDDDDTESEMNGVTIIK